MGSIRSIRGLFDPRARVESGTSQPISLFVQRDYTHLGRAVFAVVDAHRPRLAANLAVLHILLGRAAAGIDRDLHRLVTVRAVNRRPRLGGAVAERKSGVERVFVVREEHRSFHYRWTHDL